MRRLFKWLLLSCLLLLIFCAVLLIDTAPQVRSKGHEQVEHADKVSALLDDVRLSFRRRYQAQTLTVTHEQAQSLVGFLQRAMPNLRSEFAFSEDKITTYISYQLPSYLLSGYVNISAEVESAQGIQVNSVKVGALHLPGQWCKDVLEYLANSYTNTQVGSVALATIEQIDVQEQALEITLNPLDPLLRELKNANSGGDAPEQDIFSIKLAHYLRLLDSVYVPPAKANEASSSLSYYLHALMSEAKALSENEGGSATLENEAAIMALAIYAGHRRFNTFAGDLSFALPRIPAVTQKPSLAGRQDLSLHFIFSAALKLLSEQGVSIAVGEFKELMDRRQGGSGYSFVDLAADMAGAQFAALAVDPEHALQLQQVMSTQADEALFFPDISSLEEGMDKQAFADKYKAVDSPAYQDVVQTITDRLATLPIRQ